MSEVPAPDEGDPSEEADDERPDAHLADIDDGCGCAEVWEYLSERRADDGDADEGDPGAAEDRGDAGG